MPSITIRNVPDNLHGELLARAERAGQSLQAYLLAQLDALAAKPDRARLMTMIRENATEYGVELTNEQILEWRDADRR